ncbi:S41 family peptidase [Tumebacillus sp. ITR2]|uniref:S41 family peptidase n=1 Tax=Tumebacillus amylolyticus TaxID=2801339 RepID=A0ABS1JBB4_9BACL|nr:S41 family peptidase [Tumebacillus amylolyticus]MBL0387582.1 S41 family peptidase [Tumebacillus amylolyticus]
MFQGAVIEELAVQLAREYVFPEVGEEMAEVLLGKWKAGGYDGDQSPQEFALQLTDDLRAVCRDLHVRVVYNETPSERSPRDASSLRRHLELMNFGFSKVERLAGNVGYLKMDAFHSPDLAGDTLRGAMAFLKHTGAMILDMRENSGGQPEMVQLLCSYFLGAEPVLLNTIYSRRTNSTQEYWSLPYVPEARYLGKPVYVLTSRRTFSAAEELTYNLQQLKRATIVGEVTRGGANPGGMVKVHENFSVFIPMKRSINPITQTNWEGKGVTPHVALEADAAFEWAYREALKEIAEEVSLRPEAYGNGRFLKELHTAADRE